MGVRSITTWRLREEGGKLILEEEGRCTSNRMLMTFIKTTLQASHNKVVKTVVEILESDTTPAGEGMVSTKEPIS